VVPRASSPIFIFGAPGIVFGDTEGVGTRFHVLRSHNPFQPYRGHWVLFSHASCPDSFRRYRGPRVLFSSFALPDSFSVVPGALSIVFLFCMPGLVFGGNEGVGSRFHVWLTRPRFRWYGGQLDPFSCFARPDSFSAVPRASHPVFMFSAPRNVFGDIEGVGTRFHVLRSRSRFQRYCGRQVPFSCFTRPDLFSEVPRASSPVLMFYTPGLIFGGDRGRPILF
jgi:hypothetical protein